MQHGVFTRAQAAALGVSSSRVRTLERRGALIRAPAARTVLIVAGAPQTFRQAVAVATIGRPGSVASHRTAAALLRLDGCRDGTVEVTVPRSTSSAGSGAIVHWQAVPGDQREVADGIGRTRLLRTLCDLGSVAPVDVVARALDDAWRRGTSRVALAQLAQDLHRPGQRGTGVLLRLLEERRREHRAPDSWFQRLVERCLDAPDLPPLARQHLVRNGDGMVVAEIDVAFPSVRLGLEAHSRQFHFGARAERFDEQRDVQLATLGWEVLYVGWHHTSRPEAVLGSVRQVIEQRRRRLDAA